MQSKEQTQGKGLRITLGILIAAAVVLLAVSIFNWNARMQYARRLESMVTQSYYELVDQMDNVYVNMGKLMIASTPETNITLLSDLSRQADQAAENLTRMPASHPAIADTLKFVNQVSDFCRSLTLQAAHGLPLTQQNLDTLGQLRITCAAVQERVNGMTPEEVASGSLQTQDWYEEPSASDGDDSTTQTSVEYPAMIYDGPFSDGLEQRSAQGLPPEEVNAEEALLMARSYLSDRNLGEAQVEPVNEGRIPGYLITAGEPGSQLMVYIARQGGKLLWMMQETAGAVETSLSEQQCLDMAVTQLDAMGFDPVTETWTQSYDGTLVINFAAVQDGTTLYPDLIKVKVRESDGSIVALDATGYWMNHTERELSAPIISQEEAQAVLSSQLQVQSSRYCVVPTDGGDELPCWEFRATFGEDTYMIYIHAMTGAEVDIFLLVPVEGGIMVM